VKDQRTLLLAFAGLRAAQPQWAQRLRLIIVGDGALRGELERQAQELGIAPAVWFAGDRNDVAELMRLFDLFVLPSLGEGISNTILEAMATGLAVIATRVGGNPELVLEGETGILVSPGDSAALAGAMFELVTDEARRVRWGAAARSEVARRFDWDRCVEQYLALYDSVLGRAAQSTLFGISKP
jgi:glycosyltransferase involved in cell wall biosynthesis